jgi:hypothetical protein
MNHRFLGRARSVLIAGAFSLGEAEILGLYGR